MKVIDILLYASVVGALLLIFWAAAIPLGEAKAALDAFVTEVRH